MLSTITWKRWCLSGHSTGKPLFSSPPSTLYSLEGSNLTQPTLKRCAVMILLLKSSHKLFWILHRKSVFLPYLYIYSIMYLLRISTDWGIFPSHLHYNPLLLYFVAHSILYEDTGSCVPAIFSIIVSVLSAFPAWHYKTFQAHFHMSYSHLTGKQKRKRSHRERKETDTYFSVNQHLFHPLIYSKVTPTMCQELF